MARSRQSHKPGRNRHPGQWAHHRNWPKSGDERIGPVPGGEDMRAARLCNWMMGLLLIAGCGAQLDPLGDVVHIGDGFKDTPQSDTGQHDLSDGSPAADFDTGDNLDDMAYQPDAGVTPNYSTPKELYDLQQLKALSLSDLQWEKVKEFSATPVIFL